MTAPNPQPEAPRRRRPYDPPRIESPARLARAVRFGGSIVVDSGNGLGSQPGAGPRRSSSRG